MKYLQTVDKRLTNFIQVFLLIIFSTPLISIKGNDSISVINSTFLGSPERNYYGDEAPSKLNVIWKHILGTRITNISKRLGDAKWSGAGWTGQPLIFKQKDSLFLIQGAYDHNLKKINAENGELIWQYAFDDVIKGTGSLWYNETSNIISHKLIVLQGARRGYGNYTDTPIIPSYRAISAITGEELWRLNVKWTDSYSRDVDGSALILNNLAYIGLENSIFTILNPDPLMAKMSQGILQPEIIFEKRLYHYSDVIKHKNNVVTE